MDECEEDQRGKLTSGVHCKVANIELDDVVGEGSRVQTTVSNGCPIITIIIRNYKMF